MKTFNEKYRNQKRAIEVALNFCTQNELEKFILVEKEYFTKEFLKGRVAGNKEEFLYYALRNSAYDMVEYLISQGCSLSNDRYKNLIQYGIASKRLAKLYDILKHFNLMNHNLFNCMVIKLNNIELYADLEKIFIKQCGKFSYTLLKTKLDELGITIKDKNKFLFRQLLLEEMLEE
jgi:hypothetical protein